MRISDKIYCVLVLLLFSALFTACSTEVEFKGEELEPKLVVNSICLVDSLLEVEVSATKLIPGFESKFRFIPNATVKVFVDDEETEVLQCVNVGDSVRAKLEDLFLARYSGKTVVKSGKKYRVEVSHPDFKHVAVGEMTGAMPVLIESAFVEVVKNDDILDNSSSKVNASITFTDTPDEENYYRLYVYLSVGEGFETTKPNGEEGIRVLVMDYFVNQQLTSSDPVFSNNNDPNNILGETSSFGYTIFDDKLLKGKPYELSFELYEHWAWDMAHVDTTMGGYYIVHFELQSITKDVYYYLKSIDDSNESGMGLFTEPVQVYSNIANGLGIFGAASSSTYNIQYGRYPIDGVDYSYGMISY
ncbi:MAG TPA: DUF4249 domain-containing protein [Prolixibacteraceae bacterium]|nr:DUF4249 domain-containing protein [Prolixibacteraceae bacterium]